MTTASRFNTKADELPKDLVDLANLVSDLPQNHRVALEPVLQRVVDSTKRRRRILQLVQEALAQLRLDMKYLVFDLEATRRERDALESNNGDEPNGEDKGFEDKGFED